MPTKEANVSSFPCLIVAVSVAAACAAHRASPATPPSPPASEQPRIIRVLKHAGAVELVYVPWVHDIPSFAGTPDGAAGIIQRFFGPITTMEIMRLTESLLDGTSVIGVEGNPPGDFRSRFTAPIEYLRLIEQQGSEQPSAGKTREEAEDEEARTMRMLLSKVSDPGQKRLFKALVLAEAFVLSALPPGSTHTEVLELARRTNVPMVGVEDPELYCRIGSHWRAVFSSKTEVPKSAGADGDDAQKRARWREALDELRTAERRCNAEEPKSPFCRLLAMHWTIGAQAIRVLIEDPTSGCSEQPLLLDEATWSDVDARRTDRAIENLLSAARAHGARRAVLLFGVGHTKEIITSAKQRGIALTTACTPHMCAALAEEFPSLAPALRP